MAYTTQIQATSPVFGRVSALIAQIKERHAAYRVYRTTLNELSTLSSRDLADLGINRANIKSIAYEAAYK